MVVSFSTHEGVKIKMCVTRPAGGAIRGLCRLRFCDLLQDLPPQPRHELLHHLLVRRGQPAGLGRRGVADGLVLDVSISILVARRSALADLSTIWVTIASRLVIVRRRPSIVTTTVSFSASASSAGRALRRGVRRQGSAPRGAGVPVERGRPMVGSDHAGLSSRARTRAAVRCC
jgi:hypothetical protein